MARMSSQDMAKGHPNPTNPSNGVHRQLAPGEVPHKPFNVRGDVGLPTGKNGDGDPMSGGDCY